MSSQRTPQRAALAGAILTLLSAPACASSIAVDGTTCNLADAITTANTGTAAGGCTIQGTGALQLNITGNQTVTSELPRLQADMTLVGGFNPPTISGDTTHRLFFVGDDSHSPTVSFANLVLSGGVATGGSSNDGGGAGAGLGGAIFVYDGNLSVNNVTFSGNHATGGTSNGGVGTVDTTFAKGGGGGGGMFGAGGRGAFDLSNYFAGHDGGSGGFGGGGGGGAGSFGGEGGGNGGNGGGFGGLGGQGTMGTSGSLGGENGGMGGGGGGGGGGNPSNTSKPGGAGGFGGGGGGGAGICTQSGCPTIAGAGASGGFGGGGGAGGSAGNAVGAGNGGNAGFGGGAAAGGLGNPSGVNGGAGFGGGGVSEGGGGAGGGFGGAVFVRAGHVTIGNSKFYGNAATGGTGLVGFSGVGKGGAIAAIPSIDNGNGNNQGMPTALPSIAGCANAFSENGSGSAGSTSRDNVDTFGVDRTGLTLTCGDRIFADGFGTP